MLIKDVIFVLSSINPSTVGICLMIFDLDLDEMLEKILDIALTLHIPHEKTLYFVELDSKKDQR